jgi:hypothetical protein
MKLWVETLICAKKYLKKDFVAIPILRIFPKDQIVNTIYEVKLGEFKYTHMLAFDITNEILLSLSVSGAAQIRSLITDVDKDDYFLKGKYSKWYSDRILTCGTLDYISRKKYPYLHYAINRLIENKTIYSLLPINSFFTAILDKDLSANRKKVLDLFSFNSYIVNPTAESPDVAGFVFSLLRLSKFDIYKDFFIEVNAIVCRFNVEGSFRCEAIQVPARLKKNANFSIITNRPVLILLKYSPYSDSTLEIIGNVGLDELSASYYLFGKANIIAMIIMALSRNLKDLNVCIEKSFIKQIYENITNIANQTISKDIQLLSFDKVLSLLEQDHIVEEYNCGIAYLDFDLYFNRILREKFNPKTDPSDEFHLSKYQTRLCIIKSFIDRFKRKNKDSNHKRYLNALIL